jgi:CubicO group peptidase (beta-lactamase class C family)
VVSLVDSFAVFRCGRKVYERTYTHDYGKIYAKQAHEIGPLNARLTGPYNYFDPAWHPYYRGTDMHSMQSVTKTITTVIIGIAVTRGDIKAGLDTPVIRYFDALKVNNLDDRKRRMTLRHLMTMTAGFEWLEDDIPEDDPRSDMARIEATDDWIQYVIDKPMAAEPGTVGSYNSGATELLAYIFLKETGQDIADYAQRYLFGPLGIKYHWKRTYLGVVDTEGGLFLSNGDLAKIGYFFLHLGEWNGRRIVSEEWIKESVSPIVDAEDGDFDLGLMWWLLRRPNASNPVWMARGAGGQHLMVFPDEGLITVFTGWDILGELKPKQLAMRVLPAVKDQNCRINSASCCRSP